MKTIKKTVQDVKKSHNRNENNEFVQKMHNLEQELQIRTEENEKLYGQLCNAQKQIEEAKEVIKLYAETEVGHKQKDGTYHLVVCSGTYSPWDPFEFQTHSTAYVYDPRPAKKYLRKWRTK